MLPGKIFDRFFPSLQTGTHCAVNRLARRLLFLNPAANQLPHWREINEYEGLRTGVDGLWLNDQHLSSLSTYNPQTKQGNGLQELKYQFIELTKAWQARSKVEIAKRSAYLSHIVTDLFTPPHQYGQLVPARQQRWYLFWHIKDDWRENDEESLRGWERLLHWHSMFELRVLYHLARKPLTNARLYTQLIRACFTNRIAMPELIVSQVAREIIINYKLGIYPEYLRLGWTQRVEQAMRFIVLPKTVSLVATFWYLAAQQRLSQH